MLLQRSLVCLALAMVSAAQADTAPLRRGYLGLQVGRSGVELTCGTPAFACERAWSSTQVPGVQLNLVGRTRISDSFRLEGHVGFNANDVGVMGGAPSLNTDRGFRLTYGAGLRWTFSRSGSATFGLDSYDQPLLGGGHETVRAARLGLQWRY